MKQVYLFFSFALLTCVTSTTLEAFFHKVTELRTRGDFATMMSNPKPSIVMIKAAWCGACKSFLPTFEEVAKEFHEHALFYILDEGTKELQKELTDFGVEGFPTIVYIKKDMGGTPKNVVEERARGFLELAEQEEKREEKKKEKAHVSKGSSAVHEIHTKKEYDTLMKGDKPVVILTYATWCGACSMFKPTFHKLAEEFPDIAFALLNVDENEKELKQHVAQFKIESIPTTLLFATQHGKLVEHKRLTGTRSEEGFRQELQELKSGPAKKEKHAQTTPKRKTREEKRRERAERRRTIAA